MKGITKAKIIEQLQDLGIRKGDILFVAADLTSCVPNASLVANIVIPL